MDVAINGVAQGPLAGIRVLDFSTVVSGPLCTQILGDLGAEVIKVETPRGDSTRMMGPPFKEGVTPLFAQVNRNKRSCVIDLKQPRGAEIVHRLARDADVLVENFRPGVADRLGCGYEALARTNPRLIYVAISGFGPDGPYAHQPAYDMVIQALGGFAPLQGDDDTPQLIRSIIADKSSGLTAAYAVTAALFHRERHGGAGQKIDVPMLDAYAAFMLPDVMGAETFLPKEAVTLPVKPADLYRAWPTADGFVAVLVIEDHQFQAVCRALNREDLSQDQRYATLFGRIMHAAELFEVFGAEIRRWPRDQLVARAQELGAPLAPVKSLEEFLCDPQVLANRTVFDVDDPAAGAMRLLRNPVRFASAPPSLRRLPPRLGEHTDEILGEAGFSQAEIATLRDTGAVR